MKRNVEHEVHRPYVVPVIGDFRKSITRYNLRDN